MFVRVSRAGYRSLSSYFKQLQWLGPATMFYAQTFVWLGSSPQLGSFTIGKTLVRPTKIAGEWISPKQQLRRQRWRRWRQWHWSGHVSVLKWQSKLKASRSTDELVILKVLRYSIWTHTQVWNLWFPWYSIWGKTYQNMNILDAHRYWSCQSCQCQHILGS